MTSAETRFLAPKLSRQEANALSMLALAHVGDAVYDLVVRSHLCAQGHGSVTQLHKRTVEIVNAPAQARAAQKILELLTEDELSVFKRARNTKVNSVPQHASVGEYHASTAIEALLGYLYLTGETQRLEELFQIILGE